MLSDNWFMLETASEVERILPARHGAKLRLVKISNLFDALLKQALGIFVKPANAPAVRSHGKLRQSS